MMENSVRNPPVAVLAPRLAADIVAIVREGSRIRLDYSPESLALVDRAIESIRRENPPAQAVVRTLIGFGAYTGEVLVRGGRATWVDLDAHQRDTFGQPFGIRTPDGRVWNPLGKAVKRYEYGAQDSLRLFYLAVVGQAHV